MKHFDYRKHIRLPEFDYSNPGIYFVTICSYQKKHTFGKTLDGQIELSALGEIVNKNWFKIPDHVYGFQSIEFCVMPNHIHGLIELNENNNSILGSIIGSYKSSVTREYNNRRSEACLAATKVWQPNYYEHVVRNENAFDWITEYIRMNPENWTMDEENRHASKSNPFYHWLNTYWK